MSKKGDLVINPNTQRPIKVGGRIWNKLVKEGIMDGDYIDDNELTTYNEDDDEKELIKEFNNKLPPNIQAVRGRGKYKNKLVKRYKQPNIQDMSKYTSKIAVQKLKNKETYEKLYESDDFENDLNELIMEELNQIKQPRKIKKQEVYYEEEEEEEEEEESDDYYYE